MGGYKEKKRKEKKNGTCKRKLNKGGGDSAIRSNKDKKKKTE